MKAAILFSGGKDSTFALSWALKHGREVCCLLTLHSTNTASYMFHTPNIHYASVQAACLGFPILIEKTTGEKELELEDMKRLLERAKETYGIDAIVTGAVHSDYQRMRVERIAEEVGLETHSPLWHRDQLELVKEMIAEGFDIRIIHIAALGLDKTFLGKKIDAALLQRLLQLHKKYKIHVAGEGGEFETFVINGPLFKKRIEITDAEEVMENEYTGTYVIKHLETIPT